MTVVRLVVGARPDKEVPAMAAAAAGGNVAAALVSYAYWRGFSGAREQYVMRDYVLDSGAFTVKNAGGSVALDDYIGFCQRLLAEDPQCTEVFALDVIGDWRGSERNTAAMWRAGVEAIPTFHYGEPAAVLRGLAAQYPKIALGGVVGLPIRDKMRWVGQCFAAVWPKKIHGLGMASEQLLMANPFHTTDASSWQQAPLGFGNWQRFGRVRGLTNQNIDLRSQVEWYLALERRLKQRWQRELAALEEECAQSA